jgi:hypothetical protein
MIVCGIDRFHTGLQGSLLKVEAEILRTAFYIHISESTV